MLTDRIIGAFTFRKGVYAEVEQDTTFTRTAWILVIIMALTGVVLSLLELTASGFGDLIGL